MKKIFIILIIILGAYIIKIPTYVELNNLAIIEQIAINYKNEYYTIYLKEIIPKKDENGINYEYTYYKASGKNIKSTLNKLNNKTKKKLYLKKVKSLITNLNTTKKVIKELNINPQNIIHTKKDIYKKLKDN